MYVSQVPGSPETGEVSAADVLDLYLKRVFTMGVFCEQEMGSHSPKLLCKRMRSKKCLLIWLDIYLHIDEPKKYTFHSYRRSAATAVADAGATSDQMQNFLDWANAKMTTDYISTSKARRVQSLPMRVQRSPKRVMLATLGNSGMIGTQLERS